MRLTHFNHFHVFILIFDTSDTPVPWPPYSFHYAGPLKCLSHLIIITAGLWVEIVLLEDSG